MAKQNFLFITFCMLLIVGLMQSYSVFQEYFSPNKENVKKISQLKREVEQKNLETAELENQMVDFQQEVAAQLPALQKMDKGPRNFQLRSLASVTQKPLDAFEMSGPLSEQARAEFRRGDFKSAAQSFSNLTQKFPLSPIVIQAYFFWAESLFMEGRYQDCLEVVDQMMIQFPEHELTGFIMLRMGQILQTRNRLEEASEVYKTIAKNFSANHELKKQAEKLMTSLE
jgi:TolA-binding protein